MGIPGMTWVVEHTEVLTLIALITWPTIIIGTMVVMASGNTKESHELEGFDDDRE